MKILLLMTALLLGAAVQEAPTEMVAQANAAYERGEYQTAAALYEQVLEDGFRDATVYYNLGSAYYQTGELGLALLNYRRAQQISPRDSDVELGLTRIRAERVNFQGSENTLIDRLASSTYGIVTLAEFAWAAAVLWALWFGLLALWIVRPGWRGELWLALAAIGFCLLLALLPLAARVYTDSQRPLAVVVALSAPVMSGPGEEYLEIFELYAAAEMRLLETRNGWVRFILPSGRQGWLPRRVIEVV
jgi:tetratricopeptide (TPR) repeat protein